jgi:hypothetical protein
VEDRGPTGGWMAEYREANSTQEIWLCFKETDEEVVSAFVSEGAKDDFALGQLCRKLCDYRDLGIATDFAPLGGPWNRVLTSELYDECDPYLQFLTGEAESRREDPWAFIWLPTFRSNKAILATTLASIARGLRKGTTVLSQLLRDRLPLPEEVLISTSATPAKRRPTPARALGGSAPQIPGRHGPRRKRGGRPPRYVWAEIDPIGRNFLKENGRSPSNDLDTQVASRVHELCRKKGIECPGPRSLRKRVPAWRRGLTPDTAK